MSAENRFCSRYKVTYPIASAGMAFVASSPDLAIAVSAAGGFGAIGAGILPPEGVTHCLSAFREVATGPINLNFVTFMVTEATIDLCVSLKPEVVSFHWGHPDVAWIKKLQEAGIDVWEQVGSIGAAQQAVKDGVNLLIVQGSEAGGHNYGEMPLLEAIAKIRAIVGVGPLILGAGGISDGDGLASALAAGADGAIVGSRLVASFEADAHDDYKAALVASDGSDTVCTSLFGRDMPHFNPMRVIKNQIVREWHGKQADMPPQDDNLPIIATVQMGPQAVPIRRFSSFVPTRSTQGDLSEMALLAGQGIGAIQKIASVSDIIADIGAGATQ